MTVLLQRGKNIIKHLLYYVFFNKSFFEEKLNKNEKKLCKIKLYVLIDYAKYKKKNI
jgi:hypothetical protein